MERHSKPSGEILGSISREIIKPMAINARRALRKARTYLSGAGEQEPAPSSSPQKGVWIDVGAYLGTETFGAAKENPGLHVYAFEPNLRLASQYWGLVPNITVLPVAVAETDGLADFYVNANSGASSLLPFDAQGLARWIGGEVLKIEFKTVVPTIRLDTFMEKVGISCVDYLKIDAQGADLGVIRSAGERLRDIRKIKVEVATTAVPLYEGAGRRWELLDYLRGFGFGLACSEQQSYGQEENLTFISEGKA